MDELHPLVNTALMGNGMVTEHGRVIDSLGRFHGLYKLVLQGDDDYPDIEEWRELMSPDALIDGVLRDRTRAYRLVVFYKRMSDVEYVPGQQS